MRTDKNTDIRKDKCTDRNRAVFVGASSTLRESNPQQCSTRQLAVNFFSEKFVLVLVQPFFCFSE